MAKLSESTEKEVLTVRVEMKRRNVTNVKVSQARGIQVVSARVVTVKIDFGGIVRELRKFRFPNLFTLDDLLPICGLKTNADRVHLSRALRRAGIEPLRRKKITLTVNGEHVRAYIWHVGVGKAPRFRTDSDVRKEYARQHHIDLIASAARLESVIRRPQL